MAVVAVTGGTGFIGRHVVPLLLEHGHDVRTLLRLGHENGLGSRAGAVSGDVTDPAAVESLLRGAEIVLHFAGVAHTALSTETDRQCARDVNVGGARNVLDAALKHGVRRVVIASSAHVYEGQRGINVREDARQAPENLYAETKIEVERLARQASRQGLEVVIGRPCLTYGPNVGFNLLRLMRAIEKGVYFHAGHRRVERSFASVYSTASAFVFLAEEGAPGEAYNIADPCSEGLNEFANDLASRMKRRRPKRLPYPLLYTTAAGFSALKTLGFEAPLTLESLHKLTESFSISTQKLAAAGFQWPDAGERARQDMVEAYLAGGSR